MLSNKLFNPIRVLRPSDFAKALSTLPSISETSEALEYVGETERKLVTTIPLASLEEEPRKAPKLDRNGNLWLTYSIVGPERSDVVNRLLYATYHPDEPLTNHLGLYKGPSSIPDADRLVQQILPRHLSLFAYDSNGNVLGVCVNNAYYRAEFEQDLEDGLDQVIDPNFKPILAIYHELRMKNKHIYDELKTEKFFSIRMVGVDPKVRGRGVATDLIRRSHLLAGCLGFTGIKTETTGSISQKAFSRVGMLKTNSINYGDFEFEGRKVFESMNPPDTELAFMKKKFFQSCLKHIM